IARMNGRAIIISVFAVIVAFRLFWRFRPRRASQEKPASSTRKVPHWQRKLFTVYIFAKLNTRRFFRDRLALFFGILFPLIFLFVFGGISGGNSGVSFHVAVINSSRSSFAQQFLKEVNSSKLFK